MKNILVNNFKTLVASLVLSMFFINNLGAVPMDRLTVKEQNIIVISSLAAKGDLEKLRGAMSQALDDNVTINEIKEAMIQLYAYAGFPRSLNGINTLMSVVEQRKLDGKNDMVGKDASPVSQNINKDEDGAKTRAYLVNKNSTTIPAPSGYQLFAPTIDTFLKEHLFSDIFIRDIFDYKTRELITISILASLSGVEPQLESHLKISINVGFTKEELLEWTEVLKDSVGDEEANRASIVLDKVLGN